MWGNTRGCLFFFGIPLFIERAEPPADIVEDYFSFVVVHQKVVGFRVKVAFGFCGEGKVFGEVLDVFRVSEYVFSSVQYESWALYFGRLLGEGLYHVSECDE